MNETIAELGRRACAGERLSRGEIASLAALGATCPHDLMYWAWRVRTERFGNAVKFCSIVPGKLGACGEDCKWCAQSAAAAPGAAEAQRASVETICSAAAEAAGNHAASFGIVNSGRRPTKRDLAEAMSASRRIVAASDAEQPMQMCASLGELTDAQAGDLAEAGFVRYNHNLETSRRFFPRVVSSHSYDDRLRTLAVARRAGLRLCCGAIFGMGETWDDRIDVALKLRDEVQPEVVPLNFLHPIPGTALEHQPGLSAMEILTIIAIFRLVLPGVDLKIAGGRQVNLQQTQSWIFYAGATSCLIGNCLTTPGRSCRDDLRMIDELGLTVVRRFPHAR